MSQKRIIFFITSVIHFVPSPLSYSKTRSRFTPEQRIRQTIRTMESIRSKVPNAYIIFIELGMKDIHSKKLKSMADQFLYLGGKPIVRKAVDSPHKGLGEAIGLLHAHRYIQPLHADYYYKLSGRYELNQHFRLEDWLNDGFSAMFTKGWMSTRLYGFSRSHYRLWRLALMRSLPELRRGMTLERVLPKYLGNIRKVRKLGVTGVVAPWNKKIIE